MVLDAQFSVTGNGNGGGITLIDYEAWNYNPNYHGSTSKILYFALSGMLKLIGGVYTKNGSGATMFVSGGSAAAPATLIADGVSLDNPNGLPAPSAHLNTFYRGNTYPSSGNWVPIPGAYNNNYVEIGNPQTVSGNAITIPITYPLTTVTNNATPGAVAFTFTTSGATDGMEMKLRFFDSTASTQTLTYVNTENSTVTPPSTSNGSTTSPQTTTWQFNGATSKWRCIGSV